MTSLYLGLVAGSKAPDVDVLMYWDSKSGQKAKGIFQKVTGDKDGIYLYSCAIIHFRSELMT